MGLFFVFSFYAGSLDLMRAPVRIWWRWAWWRALLCIVTIDICMQNSFGQPFAIPALPSPRFGWCRTPALALVRHQSVEILDDLDAVSVRFIRSARHGASLAKHQRSKTQLRLRTTSYRE